MKLLTPFLLFLALGAAVAQAPNEVALAPKGFRSPLRMNNGNQVTTAEEWKARRAEILATWHGIMGEWPPLIERPAIELVESTQREDITQRKVRIQLAKDQWFDGYTLHPKGSGPFPAVFVPYYDPETSVGLSDKPLRDFAWQLAKRGFVALAIGSPGGDARKPVMPTGTRCQPLSFLAYLSANAWHALAAMPEVDRSRIGITGHSYGGKWSLFGSCLWDKYACAAWSDPGIVFDETRASINYQEPWYLGLDAEITRAPGLVRAESPRTGAYKVLMERGHNLHELHVLMAPRPFLVSGGAEDPPKRWSALFWALEVNKLLGFNDRVAMTNREKHDPNEESNAAIYDFFVKWLGQPGNAPK